MKTRSSEGYMPALGYRLFYRTLGEPTAGTVVCLHGGPGATHDYMLPLADLAQFGHCVVFYDQLGCGKSELPKNSALFTIERAVEEAEGVRRGLNLGRIHLIGSSYGGLLAMGYALKYQRNLKSLVTVGGMASVPLTIAEMERMRGQLSPDVLRVMREYEDLGDYENSEYLKAVRVFYRKHLRRLQEWPKELLYTVEHISTPIYHTMNGPNEFTIIGNIRYWDVTDRLHQIRVPTLVTGGGYDEVSPKVARSIHTGITRSKLVTFRNSSHLPMWEEREKFISVVRKFLDSVN